MKKPVYLDYAAATPIDPKVLAAMQPYFIDKFHNPSATYLAGRAAKTVLNEARVTIARPLGAKPSEIFFTAGATEANNLAIQGIMRQFPEGEVLVSAIEHQSVLAPANLFKCKLTRVNPQGIVDTTALKKLISNNTVLVSAMLVNNELGTIQPIREIAASIEEIRERRLKSGDKTPLYLHTDAAQASNYLDLHTARLGVDMMSLNGGKMYGSKQSGVLFVRAGIKLQPLIVGGGQEHNLRSGTENIPAVMGLAAAFDITQSMRPSESRRVNKLRQLFISELKTQIPDAVVNGSARQQAPHILHITFAGHDNERLMMELDERAIQCAVGSACNASSDQPSHVLAAIGMDEKLARASLRFSFGRPTTTKNIHYTVQILKNLINS